MAKLDVNTTQVVQPANSVLGTQEKTLHYLILGTGDDKRVVNIGEKTYNEVNKLLTKNK